MALLTAGWFQTTWFPDSYWQQDYWLEYGTAAPPSPALKIRIRGADYSKLGVVREDASPLKLNSDSLILKTIGEDI
jgi:hypothetical protein